MKKPEGHPDFPVWKLERYLLGELPAAEMERIHRAKERDPDLMGWIRALEAEHLDLAAMHPTGRVAGRIWNRLREKRSASADRATGPAWAAPRIWVPALGILLLAVLLPLNLSGWKRPSRQTFDGSEETRIKGLPPTLFLYRKSGQSASSLKTGDKVKPGELIQIYYDAAGRGYGAIFSIDQSGDVTWHLPDAGSRSAPLAKGGKVPLGFAFELDSLAGYERFFFVASDRPFELETPLTLITKSQMQSAQGPESLHLDKGISQHTLVLMKDTGI